MNMDAPSLQSAIERAGGPLQLLRTAQSGEFPYPIARQVSNWRDEQRKWMQQAILYDLSDFGSHVYIKGPDVRRLFQDVTANDFSSFGRNQAKHTVLCNYEGYLIDDTIVFGQEDDEYLFSSWSPMGVNWLQYQAKRIGGYDVEFTADAMGAAPREFSFMVQGPTALAAIRSAAQGTLPDLKFFAMGDFQIDGLPVRGFNHTMSGKPGDPDSGLEIHGPNEHRAEIKNALLTAGAEFGLQEGGSLSYLPASTESGWMATRLPAIYDGEQYREYREGLSAYGWEANMALGGSFDSADTRDYYTTPWELQYHRSINLSHDFVGRDGLIQRREDQARTRVWLRWNDDDVARVITSSLFDALPAKYLEIPNPVYVPFLFDDVHADGRSIGWSGLSAYTTNMRCFASLAVIASEYARDGAEVAFTWGEPAGRPRRWSIEEHVQTEIRATVHTQPIV